MAKIYNLTAQEICMILSYDNVKTYTSDGIAHSAKIEVLVGEIDGIKIWTTKSRIKVEWETLDKSELLPDPAEDTYYIVTREIANVAKKIGRTTDDLLIPMGPLGYKLSERSGTPFYGVSYYSLD